MVKSRRVFTREFKLAAIKELDSTKPLGFVALQLEVSANTLHRWRREFKEQPRKAFSGQGRRVLAESQVSIVAAPPPGVKRGSASRLGQY